MREQETGTRTWKAIERHRRVGKTEKKRCKEKQKQAEKDSKERKKRDRDRQTETE